MSDTVHDGALAVLPDTDTVSALVLAGGRARRMGGDDKGLMGLGGKAMVQWVSEALAAQCASVRINANRNEARYRALTRDDIFFQYALASALYATGDIDEAVVQILEPFASISLATDAPSIRPEAGSV